MKISIIGSNGFLATAIGKFANVQGWELYMYGLDAPQHHDYKEFHQLNLLTDGIDCKPFLGSDIIIYAAGAGVQSSLRENSKLIYTLNTTVPVELCRQLKESSYTGIFVTFGSVFEIGETSETHKFSEEEVLLSQGSTQSDYVISKRMLSRFATSFTHEYTHWHFIIPTIYGEGENPNRLIPYTVNAIKKGDVLHFTSGEQVRQYVYVGEVPILLAKAFELKLASGMYNIEGSETLSVKEIVSMIHVAMNKQLPEEAFGTTERTDSGMKYLALDGKKLNIAIGYKSNVKIIDVINNY